MVKKVNSMSNGCLVISLDFELFWGVRDVFTLESYKDKLKRTHEVVCHLLELFNKYNVHATWAAVGMLMCHNQTELLQALPEIKPAYNDRQLSPYEAVYDQSLLNKSECYFAPYLVSKIQQCPGQELATHTFSHYYCLESGQSIEAFASDLDAVLTQHKQYNNKPISIVFPRNQYNEAYLEVCYNKGIKVYRGNPQHFAFKPGSEGENTLLKRGIRFLDSYFNVSGHHLYNLNETIVNDMHNVPASHFLRPYSAKLNFLEPLKRRRIIKSMTQAAQLGQCYHLWWHPHNFGNDMESNLFNLEQLLKVFQQLRDNYGMQSYTMSEVAKVS